MNKKKILFQMSLLVLALPILDSQAKIFKCTSKSGNIFYNDKPCPVIDVEKKMNHVKDVKNGYIPEASAVTDLGIEKRGQPEKAKNELPNITETSKKMDSESQGKTDSSRNDSNSNMKQVTGEKDSSIPALPASITNPNNQNLNTHPPASPQSIKEVKIDQLINIKTY